MSTALHGNTAQLLVGAVEHHRAGRLREAEDLYLQVLKIQPGHADALRMLAIVFARTGRSVLAREWLTRTLAGAPRNGAVLHEIGYGFLECGDVRSALDALDRASALSPESADIHYHRGVTLHLMDEDERAGAAFRKALALRPSHVSALVEYARIMVRRGEDEEARQMLRRIEEIDNSNAAMLILAAQIAQAGERLALLRRIEGLADRDASVVSRFPDIATAAAWLCLGEGKLTEAENWIRRRNAMLPHGYDEAKFTSIAEALRNVSGSPAADFDKENVPSDRLVFVLGAPGAGQEMVRQSLLAHPAFRPSSANYTLADLAADSRRYVRDEAVYPETLLKLSEDAKRFLAQRYLSAQGAIGDGDGGLIVEAQNEGHYYLALVSELFPEALIVFVSRPINELRDSTMTLGGGYPLGHFQDDARLERHLQLCEELIEQWRSRVANPVFELSLAKFAVDPGASIEAIAARLGVAGLPIRQAHLSARAPVSLGRLWHLPLPGLVKKGGEV